MVEKQDNFICENCGYRMMKSTISEVGIVKGYTCPKCGKICRLEIKIKQEQMSSVKEEGLK